MVWKPKISWWILYLELFNMENVPAILDYKVFEAIDKFGRVSVPLEMEKERKEYQNPSTVL